MNACRWAARARSWRRRWSARWGSRRCSAKSGDSRINHDVAGLIGRPRPARTRSYQARSSSATNHLLPTLCAMSSPRSIAFCTPIRDRLRRSATSSTECHPATTSINVSVSIHLSTEHGPEPQHTPENTTSRTLMGIRDVRKLWKIWCRRGDFNANRRSAPSTREIQVPPGRSRTR